MDGLLHKQPVIIKEGGHDSFGGGLWFAMIAIFLVVLFVLIRRDRHDGGYENMLPAMLPYMNANKGHGGGYEDYKLTELLKDQAKDTGAIIHNNDQQTAQLQHTLDMQECTTQKMLGEVMLNQNKCALDAERLFNVRTLDEKNDKLAEMRLALAEKEAKILHQETVNAIARSNCELNQRLDHISGHVDHRLTRMEDHMLKKPPFFAAGGVPFVHPCVPTMA